MMSIFALSLSHFGNACPILLYYMWGINDKVDEPYNLLIVLSFMIIVVYSLVTFIIVGIGIDRYRFIESDTSPEEA